MRSSRVPSSITVPSNVQDGGCSVQQILEQVHVQENPQINPMDNAVLESICYKATKILALYIYSTTLLSCLINREKPLMSLNIWVRDKLIDQLVQVSSTNINGEVWWWSDLSNPMVTTWGRKIWWKHYYPHVILNYNGSYAPNL